MKIKYNKLTPLVILFLFATMSCNELENIKKEQYKKVVYALSYYSNNVYEGIINLSKQLDTGYISICLSGTQTTTEDIKVTLIEDKEQFDKYNISNFDLDSSKYAKLLSKKFYNIPSFEATIKKGGEQGYALLPIYLKPSGLSPDSTYIISLKIKDASGYEINPKRETVLYRLYLENEYAQQRESTSYFMKGERLREGEKAPIPVSSTKRAFPISGNSIRTYVDTYGHLEDTVRINRYSCIIIINKDNTVDFKPYRPNLIQVEKLKDSKDVKTNTYYTEFDIRGELQQRFKLYYRFRTKNLKTGQWSLWTNMKESLKRQN